MVTLSPASVVIVLFTANADLIVRRVAMLNDETFGTVLTAIIDYLQGNLPPELDNK